MAKKAKTVTGLKSVNSKLSGNKNLTYALIVLVLILILYWAMKMGAKNNYTSQYPTKNLNNYPEIVGNDGLDQASKDLESTNLNEIDTELNRLNSDSSSF